MIIKGYGIELHRLQESDIETVRNWRNADYIRDQMQYKEIISQEQQLEWFKKVNTVNNNYMLIKAEGESIGVINDRGPD